MDKEAIIDRNHLKTQNPPNSWRWLVYVEYITWIWQPVVCWLMHYNGGHHPRSIVSLWWYSCPWYRSPVLLVPWYIGTTCASGVLTHSYLCHYLPVAVLPTNPHLQKMGGTGPGLCCPTSVSLPTTLITCESEPEWNVMHWLLVIIHNGVM